jgi:hypothetical protein
MQYPSTNRLYGQDVVFCGGRRKDIMNCFASRQSAPEYACVSCMDFKLIVYTDTFSHEATYCADRSQTCDAGGLSYLNLLQPIARPAQRNSQSDIFRTAVYLFTQQYCELISCIRSRPHSRLPPSFTMYSLGLYKC